MSKPSIAREVIFDTRHGGGVYVDGQELPFCIDRDVSVDRSEDFVIRVNVKILADSFTIIDKEGKVAEHCELSEERRLESTVNFADRKRDIPDRDGRQKAIGEYESYRAVYRRLRHERAEALLTSALDAQRDVAMEQAR